VIYKSPCSTTKQEKGKEKYHFVLGVHGDIRNVLYCIAFVKGKREPKKKWEHTRNLENRHNINAIYIRVQTYSSFNF
jgi:hypothetical protein